MTSITTAAWPWPAAHRWSLRIVRRHPEWFIWSATIAAWAAVVLLDVRAAQVGDSDHFHHGWVANSIGWLVMVVAMMGPNMAPPLRRVAMDSLPRRRSRAMFLWLSGYLAVWTVFGAIATALASFAGGARWAIVSALLVAAAYELAKRKRRALRSCHRMLSLPPTGRKADIACARAGLQRGRACVTSCWALMLSLAMAGHGALLLMVVLSTIAVAERWLVVGGRIGGPVAGVLVAAAAVAAF